MMSKFQHVWALICVWSRSPVWALPNITDVLVVLQILLLDGDTMLPAPQMMFQRLIGLSNTAPWLQICDQCRNVTQATKNKRACWCLLCSNAASPRLIPWGWQHRPPSMPEACHVSIAFDLWIKLAELKSCDSLSWSRQPFDLFRWRTVPRCNMMQPPVRLSKRLLENTGIRNPINQDSVGQRGKKMVKGGN